jgi:hypothetical protein
MNLGSQVIIDNDNQGEGGGGRGIPRPRLDLFSFLFLAQLIRADKHDKKERFVVLCSQQNCPSKNAP